MGFVLSLDFEIGCKDSARSSQNRGQLKKIIHPNVFFAKKNVFLSDQSANTHVGVNSNIFLIRLARESGADFYKNTLIDQNIFNNIFVLHKIVLPLCRCSS